MTSYAYPSEPVAGAAMAAGKQFASLAEAFQWLASRIDYERSRWMPYAERYLPLNRMRQLLALLGHPENAFSVVHVAGTKGKGSTSAMVAEILQAAGYKTGLFTSPHLEKLQERIRINGQMPTDGELLDLLNDLWLAVSLMDQQQLAQPTDSELRSLRAPATDRESSSPGGHCLSAENSLALPSENDTIGHNHPPQPITPTMVPPVPSEVSQLGNLEVRFSRGGAAWVCEQANPPLASQSSPTYFEILTAMAMRHFAYQKVQAAVLEVGLGGRLDATNVCRPIVSLITSISFDHTQLLGNTLEAIAAEKAGIVKPGIPVVSGVTQPGPREVIRQVCQTQQAPLIELQEQFSYSYQPPRNLPHTLQPGRLDFHYYGPGGPWTLERVELSLLGRHQAANAALALATIALLRQAGWRISDQACRQALADLRWPARCQLLPGRPAVLLDTSHNVASVEALLQVLEESFVRCRRVLVFATTQDKDVSGMLAHLLPEFDEVVLTNYLDNPRALSVEQLARLAHQISGRTYPIAPSPAEAWQMAQTLAGPEDLLCITGSFFLIGQILPVLRATGYLP
ncbi:MAG: bifunctional folylpolyglutamate synthase/dihydrofolate synthase [Thermoguttaceae bacterium]|nr:bifunctional folylpolyglutamate synthase/dihydrofolate synthase [Thermoguttaceae bacterium]MDW8036521.1 folylpolyglutamate synthase/dihydrofolate synthase family protein [Thermoguttaceae bacterium]